MSTTSTSAPITISDTGIGLPVSLATLWIAPLVAFVASLLAALYLFRQTAASLVAIWSGSRTYSYGFVIIPIVALLTWHCKERLKAVQPRTSLLGVLCVLFAVALWLAGNVADVQLVQHIALITIIDGLVWTFFGTTVLRILAFPLLFLFFAVPVGDSLVPVLQRWTAAFTVGALRLSGIPAVQDGFLLSTPSGDWQVAEACSGIRYLLASIVIGVLVAGVAYRNWKRRIGFLLLSALLPIVANAIRAYGIVVLAYLSGNAIATGVDHVVYGFLFFSFLTATLITVAMRSFEPEAPVGHGPVVVSRSSSSPGKLLIATFLVVAIATGGSTMAHRLWEGSPVLAKQDAMDAPAGWTLAPTESDEEWAPNPSSVRTRTIRSYTSELGQVSVCLIEYPETRRGVELINSFNLVGASAVWTVLSSDTKSTVIAGQTRSVTEYVMTRGPQRRMVWLWYRVGNTTTSSPYRLRFMQALNRLLGLPSDTYVYAISTSVGLDPAEAENTLLNFVK